MTPCEIKLLMIEFREFCVLNLYLKVINDCFSRAGFRETEITPSVSGDKRILIERFFASEKWEEIEALQKLIMVIENTLQWHYLSEEAKEQLRRICRESGLKIEDKGSKITYDGISLQTTLFKQQFPAGLPFGVPKPDFIIKAQSGIQILKFELKHGIGIIETDAYPNFTFSKLEESQGLDSSTNKVLKKALVNMNQSEYEKKFFLAYAKKFEMANRNVPVLVPQAWIQWHSLPKRNLRSASSSHTDELYRVDFVAFWNNRRFAILVDDIGHYAVKRSEKWLADEESYAKRLKEDRKLRKENWNVFRISNWEIKQEDRILEYLEDFREFVGFK